MQTSFSGVLGTGQHVQAFLNANAAQLPTVVNSGARKQLDAAVTALQTHGNDLESGKQQSVAQTEAQEKLVAPLLKLMRSINRVGKLVSSSVPDYSPLVVPTVNDKLQTVLEQANAMCDAVTPHAQTLIDAGLPADFLAQLSAATAAVSASTGSRSTVGDKRVAATGGTKIQASAVRKAIAALDGLVKLALAENDALLAAWKRAKRYHVIPRATPATPTTPATPAKPTAESTPAPTPTSTTPTEAAPPKAA